jgi:molybdate transport system substrate-binding protein
VKGRWLALALVAGSTGCKPAKSEPLRVAAAADLQLAFAELGQRYAARTGVEVVFNFGSTGLLATQLIEGAPFDVFAAANAEAIDDTVQAKVCEGASAASYATGALALYSPQQPLVGLEDLKDPRFARLAMAQPAHAPYGRAAKQVLEGALLWPELFNRVVYAQNVSQALQYARTGNVEAAFISRSLRSSIDAGIVLDLPVSLHAPLTQRLATCVNGKRHDLAAGFAQLVVSAEGQAVLARHGFLPP